MSLQVYSATVFCGQPDRILFHFQRMYDLLLNAPLIETPSHKVVLVIDRSPKFAEPINTANISFCLKDDQNLPINGKLEKKLWNCSVEAVIEFHRVVTDLFPRGDKCLRFVISDFVGRFLTPNWSSGAVISHEQLLNTMALCELPQGGGDSSSCSIFNGILLGLEALSEQTESQKKAMDALRNFSNKSKKDEEERMALNVAEAVRGTSTDERSSTTTELVSQVTRAVDSSHEEGEIREQQQTMSSKGTDEAGTAAKGTDSIRMRNRGCLVVLTMIDSLSDYEGINEYIAEQVVALNETNRNLADKKSMPIDQVDLFVLNVVPHQNGVHFSAQKHRPNFHSRLISVKAGSALVTGMHKVLQDIYGLVSTTVCGIPMKEEAQSGQSVNYDVEMLHPLAAHSELRSLGLLDTDSKLLHSSSAHDKLFTSIRLKWCTANPKLKSDMFPLLQRSFPITPAHVNLRQTVCLTSFITNGRSVLLEIFPDAYQSRVGEPKLGPNLQQKLISHYLSRDANGALILHCVAMGEKANLCAKLSSQQVYGAVESSAEFAKNLNRGAFLQLIKAAQIVPFANEKFKMIEEPAEEESSQELGGGMRSLMDKERNGKRKGQRDCAELTGIVERVAGIRGIPFALHDSFIYNVPEKFEPLLSTLPKLGISEEQFGQCKAQLIALVASKNKEPLTEKTFECKLLSTGRSDTAPKEEHYRVAFDELCRLLHNFSHISETHQELLTLFTELSGLRLPHAQKRKRELSPMVARTGKRPKKELWKPGEKLNVYELLRQRYEQEYWAGWKGEFEGRVKYGDKAQEFLYPNLKLPPGQVKYAGTGGAGPIE